MKNTILRLCSIGLATLGLGMGLAAASTVTMSNTGPDSSNTVTISNTNSATVSNNNFIGCQQSIGLEFVQPEFCGNFNSQTATSGDAKVIENTHAGSARSGDAENSAGSSFSVSLFNGFSMPAGLFGGSDSVSMNSTGPSSDNDATITNSNSWSLENNNQVQVSNFNAQTAGSGGAKVIENTNGGSATTGSASNTSNTNTQISVHN